MTAGRSRARTVVAVAGVTALSVLAAEGVLSLAFGLSLLSGADRVDEAPLARTQRDEERFAAAAANPGLYRVHPDPLVGFVMRADAELAIHDGAIRTDALGLRRRTGPEPAADAIRIVVLGDSVAFGFGVDDDAALAQQLEDRLAALRGDTGARDVVCRTVAMPGWNHRNAVRFLLDHLDALDPDVVLYMPIGNDLSDTDGVWETGHRRVRPDVGADDPWLLVNTTLGHQYAQRLFGRVARRGIDLTSEGLGARVLNADISPESSRRYDAMAASIGELHAVLARRGAELLLLQYVDDAFAYLFQERLIEAGVDVPVVPLLTHVTPEDTLGFDPHPNAETLGALAAWIADDLIARGLVDADGGAAPAPLPPRWDDRRAAVPTAARVRRVAAEHRERERALLRPAIDFETGHGVYQVYGGLNPDGSVGTRLLAAVERAGDIVEIRLMPIPGRPDLYPLAVDVDLDDRAVGVVEVPERGEGRGRFALPAGAGDVIEVRLSPRRWVVIDDRGTSRLASFLPRRIECGG